MKKRLCFLTAIIMMSTFSACGNVGNQSCEKCDKIVEIQSRIDELSVNISKNADMEGSYEYDKNEEELYSLREQLDLLLQHECSLPAENVTNQECRLGVFTGKYTGEWKSNAPHGSGVFEGTDDSGNLTMYYSGGWEFGTIQGYGEYELHNSLNNSDISYKGDFRDNKYDGSGVYYQNLHMNSDKCITIIDGEFSEGILVTGDFQEKDQNGNLTDYGTMQGSGWTKTSSAKADAEAKRQQQVEDQFYDAASEFFNAIWN